MEPITSVFGIKQIWVRVGATEYPLQAAQDAQFTAKQTLVELMGDNAITPLDIQPKKTEVSLKGKYGQLSLVALNAILGGTETSVAAGAVTTPAEENGGCSMLNAMGVPSISDVTKLITDGWTFVSISPTQYQIVKSSDGSILGTFTVGYANTAIPGITITVNGTLTANSWASFQTTAQTTGSVEKNSMNKSDFPSQVTIRMVTEGPTGESQLEIVMFKAQPNGITIPAKTKDFAYIDFEFMGLFDPNVGKIFEIRKYDRPLVTC